MPDYVGGTQPIIRAPTKTITFDGSAGNGAVGTVAVWTITGRIWLQAVIFYVSTSLTGALAQISCGVSGSTQAFNGSTTATTLTSANWWSGGAVDADPGALQPSAPGVSVLGNIFYTVGTANVTGGVLIADAFYIPLTSDASLA